jgi:hypothetical protein
MHTDRQFIAPMSAAEAAERSKYVLGKWKFKCWSVPNGIRFERSVPFAGLMVIHPHHVHCRIDLFFRDREDGSCEVRMSQQVFKFGQPSTNLDKQVWHGDTEDVEANLVRREEPRIDRTKQNSYAGLVSVKYLLISVLPPLVVAGWLVAVDRPIGAICCVLVVVAAAIVMPRLPFRMPDFPLDNQVPTAPFTSNYPRTRH